MHAKTGYEGQRGLSISELASHITLRNTPAAKPKQRSVANRTVWVLLADGAYDQMCYSEREMKREKRDLEEMGFKVKVKTFPNVKEAEAFEDKMRGY